MNTYTWNFPKLQAYTQQFGQQNVIYVVYWYLKGSDPTGQYEYETYGFQQIAPYQAGAPFIPYDQLTKETVQSWVEAAMGQDKVQELKSDIDKRIEDLKNPPIVFLEPIWSSSLS